MQEFKQECTINIHLESRGQPAKFAWACSIYYEKGGRLILANRFLGMVSREEAELELISFALHQAARLNQEKVELWSAFPVEGIESLDSRKYGKRLSPELQLNLQTNADLWASFRLRRMSKIDPSEEQILRQELERILFKKRKRD